jgi:hypothetical protein
MALEIMDIRREVEDAFKESGECFLCIFEERQKERLEKYIDKIVTDPQTREALGVNGSLCEAHVKETLVRMAQGTIDTLSTALIVKALIQARLSEVERQLSNMQLHIDKSNLSPVDRIKSLRSFWKDSHLSKGNMGRPCPICDVMLKELRSAVDAFIEALRMGDEGIVKPFKASGGICIPHYRIILDKLMLMPEPTRNIVALQLTEVQYTSLRKLNSQLFSFIDRDVDIIRNGGADPGIILKGAEKLAGRRSLGSLHDVAWSSADGPRKDVLQMDRLGEIERLTLERDRLKDRIVDLSKRLSDLDTMYTGLHFRSYGYVEDNKALLIQISGLRGEVNMLRRSLERRGETPPTPESRSSDKENEMKEKYLFFKRRTEADEEQSH